MSNKFETLLTGFTGATLIELTASLPTAEEITHLGQILIQLAIGIVTLIRLLKGHPKQHNNNDQNNTPQQ